MDFCYTSDGCYNCRPHKSLQFSDVFRKFEEHTEKLKEYFHFSSQNICYQLEESFSWRWLGKNAKNLGFPVIKVEKCFIYSSISSARILRVQTWRDMITWCCWTHWWWWQWWKVIKIFQTNAVDLQIFSSVIQSSLCFSLFLSIGNKYIYTSV